MTGKYFDSNTGSLLSEITTGRNLVFKSEKTGEKFDAKDSDSMVAADVLKGDSSHSKWDDILAHASKDRTNARIRSPCAKCKTVVVMYLRLDNNRKIYYICPTCDNKWSNE